jgi:hypothetical protein
LILLRYSFCFPICGFLGLETCETDLDLRPLTVIIGPNNSNKTYIAYAIYGLWEKCNHYSGFMSDVPSIIKLFTKNTETEFVLSLEDTKATNAIFKCMYKFVRNRRNMFLRELSEYFQDSSLKIFSQTNLELDLNDQNLLETIKNLEVKEFNNDYQSGMSSFISSTLTIKDNKLIIKSGGALPQDSIYHTFSGILEDFIGQIIHFLFKNPFLMPAERNSFVITYKMLETRRYRLLRDNRRRFSYENKRQRQLDLLKEQGDIRYPQPIEDFLDFLADVELETNIENGSNPKRKEFCEVADKIEKTIQGKNKTNFKPTKLGGKEIKINVKRGLDIDLYNASSSIKQLAPLLLYLRYRAKENDLLIIDEPEMNLHPESQAKLLEVLGMLVNAGVNVLLTTHSPYFMSHLNNLISGDMTDERIREKQAKSLYLEDARAFLSPDDVSAYEMKKDRLGNQKLHDLKDKDYGIRWDTLSDVSADIQQKFFEIYEQKENSSNGKEEN